MKDIIKLFVAHACNSRTKEAKEEGSWLRGQSRLHGKILSENKPEKQRKKNSSKCLRLKVEYSEDIYFTVVIFITINSIILIIDYAHEPKKLEGSHMFP